MAVTVTPYFCENGAAEALEFYKRAFAAQERYRIPWEGRIGHAEIVIGETVLFLSDEAPDLGVLSPTTLRGNSVSFTLSVPDAEAAFQRALDAGATVERPLKNEPYGRTGWVIDPFGHRWAIQTPNPDFKPEDM
jgi:PhnB protein